MLVQVLGGTGIGKNSIELPDTVRSIIRDFFLTTEFVVTFRNDHLITPFLTKDGMYKACLRIIAPRLQYSNQSEELRENSHWLSDGRNNMFMIAFVYLQTRGYKHVHPLSALDIFRYNRYDATITNRYDTVTNTKIHVTMQGVINALHGENWTTRYLHTTYPDFVELPLPVQIGDYY